jgi:hypothetical protein
MADGYIVVDNGATPVITVPVAKMKLIFQLGAAEMCSAPAQY